MKIEEERRAMELQGGIPLLVQQYKALLKKNYLLAWRNKPATFLQLFSSFFFILLLFGIKKSEEVRNRDSSYAKDLRDPQPLVMPPIPPCEDKFFIKKPCYDFIWSGKRSKTIGDIVKKIMANNPGRPIPPNKVGYICWTNITTPVFHLLCVDMMHLTVKTCVCCTRF